MENKTLSSYEEKINETISGTTRDNFEKNIEDVLWNGIADSIDKEYILNRPVNEYKRLIIYSSLSETANIKSNIASLTLETTDICYPENEGYDSAQFIVGGTYSDQYIYSIRFSFTKTDRFKLQNKIIQGWSSGCITRIDKIIGIK